MMSSQLEREETYLSGLSSPSIRKSRLDPRCLGLYVTNKRIFVVRAPIWMQIMFLPSLIIAAILEISAVVMAFFTVFFSMLQAASTSSGVVAPFPLEILVLELVGLAFLFEGLLTGWYRNSSSIPIQELEKRSVYQIEKVKVSRLEYDRHVFLPSHIAITSSAGERFSILFSESGTFDRAKHALGT